jgi:hypothetical protein
MPSALAVDGAFVNKSGATWDFVPNVYFVDSTKSYIDLTPDNQDLGIAACGIASSTQYGTAAYAANVSGTWTYVVVGYDGATKSYAAMDNDISAICTSGYASLPANFGVASSTHTLYDPSVYVAAFPANLFLLVRNSDSGAPTNVYQFNNSKGKFLGSFDSVTADYNQVTHNVTIDFSTITFTKIDGDVTKSKAEGIYGITANRRMVIASCSEQYGVDCAGAKVISATGQLPVELETDVTSPSDSVKYTRFAVLNGIGTSYCIGPELQASNVSITPTNPLYSQSGSVNITVTINNNGNVNVSTPFNVSVWQDGVGGTFIQNLTIDSLLNASTNTTVLTGVNLANKTSGAHTIDIKVEDTAAGIEDCDSHTNDQASVGFTIIKTYSMTTYINGTAGTNFPQVGKPYNFSVHAIDSDGDDVASGIIHVVEKNGASLIPMQFWNESTTNLSVVPYSIAEVTLNSSGWREFTVIPTGNKMIADEPNIADYFTGNYSLYVELYTSDGAYRLTKNLTVGSLTPDDPTQQINVNNQDVINSAYGLVYRIYSTVKKWLNY